MSRLLARFCFHDAIPPLLRYGIRQDFFRWLLYARKVELDTSAYGRAVFLRRFRADDIISPLRFASSFRALSDYRERLRHAPAALMTL